MALTNLLKTFGVCPIGNRNHHFKEREVTSTLDVNFLKSTVGQIMKILTGICRKGGNERTFI